MSLARICWRKFPCFRDRQSREGFALVLDYFSLPKPEYHYTFRYGNAQFFMIDSNKPLGPKSPQYEWLEKELAASKATWKFTCHHHPCFSSEENDYGDHNKGAEGTKYGYGDRNARQLVPLYEKYGVDIAFNGHIHMYERTWPIFEMAINQQQGVRTSRAAAAADRSSRRHRSGPGSTSIFKRRFTTATPRSAITIIFKAYDIDGLMFDTFELTRQGAVAREGVRRELPRLRLSGKSRRADAAWESRNRSSLRRPTASPALATLAGSRSC